MKRINLLDWTPPAKPVSFGRLPIIIITVLCGITVVILQYSRVRYYQSRVVHYRSEIRALQAQSEADSMTQARIIELANEKAALNVEVENAIKDLENISRLVDRQYRPDLWIRSLETLLPEDVWLDRMEGRRLETAFPQVVFYGGALHQTSVNELIALLEQFPPVVSMEVDQIKQIEDPLSTENPEIIDFRLRCRLLPGRERYGKPWLEEVVP